MRYQADYLDAMADLHDEQMKAELEIFLWEQEMRYAKYYGDRVSSFHMNDPRNQLVKWIRKTGPIRAEVPLAGGVMHTTTRLVDVDGEDYYFKTGVFIKDGKKLRTCNPDDVVLQLVERSVRNGNVY